MHDANGNKLSVGDTVIIRAKVIALCPGEDFCNVTIETLLGRRPDGAKETIGSMNTGVMERANLDGFEA